MYLSNRKKMNTGICSRMIVILCAAALMFCMFVFSGETAKASETDTNDIPVTVEMKGSGFSKSTFRIILESVDNSPKTVDGIMEKEVTLTYNEPSKTVVFKLPKLTVGSYSYRIKQEQGSDDYLDYDKTVYDLVAFVENAPGGGTSVILVKKTDKGEKPDNILFSNRYTGPDTTIGDPPITINKTVSGDPAPKDHIFTFEMRPDKESYPLPEGRKMWPVTVKLHAGETVEIGNIPFDKEGTYTYRIVEKDEKLPGYNYDDATFKIVYVVKRDNEGKLVCNRTILKNSSTATGCSFVNAYDKEAAENGDPYTDRSIGTGDGQGPLLGLLEIISALLIMIVVLYRHGKRRQGEQQ